MAVTFKQRTEGRDGMIEGIYGEWEKGRIPAKRTCVKQQQFLSPTWVLYLTYLPLIDLTLGSGWIIAKLILHSFQKIKVHYFYSLPKRNTSYFQRKFFFPHKLYSVFLASRPRCNKLYFLFSFYLRGQIRMRRAPLNLVFRNPRNDPLDICIFKNTVQKRLLKIIPHILWLLLSLTWILFHMYPLFSTYHWILKCIFKRHFYLSRIKDFSSPVPQACAL